MHITPRVVGGEKQRCLCVHVARLWEQHNKSALRNARRNLPLIGRGNWILVSFLSTNWSKKHCVLYTTVPGARPWWEVKNIASFIPLCLGLSHGETCVPGRTIIGLWPNIFLYPRLQCDWGATAHLQATDGFYTMFLIKRVISHDHSSFLNRSVKTVLWGFAAGLQMQYLNWNTYRYTQWQHIFDYFLLLNMDYISSATPAAYGTLKQAATGQLG